MIGSVDEENSSLAQGSSLRRDAAAAQDEAEKEGMK